MATHEEILSDLWCVFNSESIMCTDVAPDGSLTTGKLVSQEEVATVLWSYEWSNSLDWGGSIFARLVNGRLFFASGQSDITFSDASQFVADSQEALFQYAMTPEESQTILAHLLRTASE